MSEFISFIDRMDVLSRRDIVAVRLEDNNLLKVWLRGFDYPWNYPHMPVSVYQKFIRDLTRSHPNEERF